VKHAVIVAIVSVLIAACSSSQMALDRHSTTSRAPATTQSATGESTPVLGRVWHPGIGQTGYGEVRPTAIFNGGDPTGRAQDVRWDSWGVDRAIGHGTAEYLKPNQIVADGSFEPATLVAYDLGDCHGRIAYRALTWYFPEHGGHFDSRDGWNVCDGP
jgi:hypothetical protein